MIIAESNELAVVVHDRIPAFLTEQQFEPWLSGEARAEYLKPVADGYLQRWPVSKRVNSSKTDSDDPSLIVARVRSFYYGSALYQLCKELV
jgi:putative SOS response-associated peptidase YedK